MAAPSPDLVFAQTPLAGSPTHLVFGDDGTSTLPPVTVDVSTTLSGTVSVSVLAAVPVRVEAVVLLSGAVTVTAAVVYDNRVINWIDARSAATHNPATARALGMPVTWATSLSQRQGTAEGWQRGAGAGVEPPAGHSASLPRERSAAELTQLAIAKAQASAAAHQKAVFHDLHRASGYTLGDDRWVAKRGKLQTGIFKPGHRTPVWQQASATRRLFDSPVGASLHFAGVQAADGRWQMAGWPAPGRTDFNPPPPPQPPVFYWDADLLFECPPLLFPALLFGAQPCYFAPVFEAPFYILPARFYMTAHTIYAQRLPDLADVPIFEATVSADAGSYCWSLSASGPASLFALLAPVAGLPVQLRLWLDGLAFVFAVDALSRNQKFGQTGVTVSGRSVTALIGAPYLRATTRGNAAGSAMAQQLALDALQSSGIGLDWGVASGASANAGLADWLVPAGAWSHSGTPLDAVQAIAQAAGGYLQSHRSAATLLTRHPYGQRTGDNPGAPWGWMSGAADVELASDAIITEGLERKDGPDLNAVYVSGTTQGVLGLVKRTGSAGDKLAAMVTDPLITHVDAARQRGLSVLGAAGSKYHVRLELPVLTGAGQPGVLDVGQLVQINAAQPWRGRVRAVSVNAKRPSLRQSVTLERHLETVI